MPRKKPRRDHDVSVELFADYFQFYVQDDDELLGNLSEPWSTEATERLLAVAPGVVGVGTARNHMVPVTVTVASASPPLDLADWDHVIEANIEVRQARIVVAGCTEYFPDAHRIDVPCGDYRVRVCFAGLDTVEPDGIHGDDSYAVSLWPSGERGIRVLKSHSRGSEPGS